MSCLSFKCQHRYPGGFELDASFEAGGGITSLFGPSGSGKSTILAAICGILSPNQGQICLGDRVLLDTARGIGLRPEQRHIGMVFQDHLLFPHLTIEANLRYGLRRRPTRQIAFGRLVELLELGDMLQRYPHTLSGGQRQRTALGRAILSGPELLLMDEPLTSLDAGIKDRILTYLDRAIGEWRIPTLFVTHDQADVQRLADQVVRVEAGNVITIVDAGPRFSALTRSRPSDALTKMK